MPTLFTALLARHTKKTTLAPKNQRPPAHAKIEKLSDHQQQELVADAYAGAFAKMVFLEEPKKSVYVVGAALAGLAAAYELRRRGYPVRILEASDRVGGRTWSNHATQGYLPGIPRALQHIIFSSAALIAKVAGLEKRMAKLFRMTGCIGTIEPHKTTRSRGSRHRCVRWVPIIEIAIHHQALI